MKVHMNHSKKEQNKKENFENQKEKMGEEIERVVNQRVENTTDNSFYSIPQTVPEIEERWPEELWNKVREAKEGSNTWVGAPIEEVDLDKGILDYELQSMYGDQGTEGTFDIVGKKRLKNYHPT